MLFDFHVAGRFNSVQPVDCFYYEYYNFLSAAVVVVGIVVIIIIVFPLRICWFICLSVCPPIWLSELACCAIEWGINGMNW